MPNSPIASPRYHLPIDSTAVAGPSASGAAEAGKALLEEISARVIKPDLSKFRPNGQFDNEAALKRSTLAVFIKASGFRQLRDQTANALEASGTLNQTGKSCLMTRSDVSHCLKNWGFIQSEIDPESLNPDLYDLYSEGLPNLARAVAVCHELRAKPIAVDALSQREIRQTLRNLFAHRLTVCIPDVIQNIEEAWTTVANCVETPLHYAIRDKKELARKALVDLKADTNVQDAWGRKPGESGKLSAMLRRMR